MSFTVLDVIDEIYVPAKRTPTLVIWKTTLSYEKGNVTVKNKRRECSRTNAAAATVI